MSIYSTNLKIELMQTGQNTGTWGNVTNTNLGTALEEAIVGNATITFNSADVNLNNSQYWDDLNSSLPARNVRLVLSGTSGGARQLIVPDGIEKTYIIQNNLADTVTVRTSAGAGVAVPTTKTMWVYSDSLNVVDVTTHLSNLTLGTPLAVASGGTGSNTGVNVQTSISGILPVANGGTGSATAAFNGSLITNLNATAITSGTLDNARTSANTANQSNAIVVRDTGGNFAANTITADLLGNVIGNLTGSASLNVLSSAFTGANQSLSSNGYQKFPGGLVVQWGFIPDAGSSPTINVTFPTTFPNACFSVVTQLNSNAANYQSTTVGSVTTTGFTLRWDAQVLGAYYIAIGY